MRAVPCKEHKAGRVKHKHCVAGKDVLTWLMQHGTVAVEGVTAPAAVSSPPSPSAEATAVALANKMLECHVFTSLVGPLPRTNAPRGNMSARGRSLLLLFVYHCC